MLRHDFSFIPRRYICFRPSVLVRAKIEYRFIVPNTVKKMLDKKKKSFMTIVSLGYIYPKRFVRPAETAFHYLTCFPVVRARVRILSTDRRFRRSRVAKRILASGNGRFLVGRKKVPDHEGDDQHNPPEGFPHSGHHTAVRQHGVEKLCCGRQGGYSRKSFCVHCTEQEATAAG